MASQRKSKSRSPGLKGVTSKTTTLASGKKVTYYYAWKGGDRLEGEPGTPEFAASYAKAHQSARAPKPTKTLNGLVQQYRMSPEFAGLRPSTKSERERWFTRISEAKIASLPQATLNDVKVKRHLLDWRNTFAANPRKADYAFQVLSATLSWGVHQGLIERNIILGTPQLYSSNRADQIWLEDEIARFEEAAPSPEVAFIIRLAALTGIRRDDLVKLSWTHVRGNSISFATGKSNGRKTVIIPLLPEARKLLEAIKAQQIARYDDAADRARKNGKTPPPVPLTILTNTRLKPWTKSGLEHQVIDTKGPLGIDKHLHDARGTFATRLCIAGATNAEIATILGWEESRVARVRALYVDGDAVAAAIAERVAANEGRSKTPERIPE